MRGIDNVGRAREVARYGGRRVVGTGLRRELGADIFGGLRTGDDHVISVVASSSLRGAYLAIDSDFLNVRLRLRRRRFILAVKQLHHVCVHHGSSPHPKRGCEANTDGTSGRIRRDGDFPTLQMRHLSLSDKRTREKTSKPPSRARRVFFPSVGERERGVITRTSACETVDARNTHERMTKNDDEDDDESVFSRQFRFVTVEPRAAAPGPRAEPRDVRLSADARARNPHSKRLTSASS